MSITGCVYSPSAQYIVTASNDCTGTYLHVLTHILRYMCSVESLRQAVFIKLPGF